MYNVPLATNPMAHLGGPTVGLTVGGMTVPNLMAANSNNMNVMALVQQMQAMNMNLQMQQQQ